MAAGPAIMGVGVLLLVRIPATSRAWRFDLPHLSTWVPPVDYARYVLPGMVVFGIGLMILAAIWANPILMVAGMSFSVIAPTLASTSYVLGWSQSP